VHHTNPSIWLAVVPELALLSIFGRDALAAPTTQPDAVVLVVRVSESLVQPSRRGPVEQQTPVQMQVLGAQVSGTARTRGVISFDFTPRRGGAAFLVSFAGSTVSKTVSRSGPAVVGSTARTAFAATKEVHFTVDGGFVARPARTSVSSRRTTDSIRSTLPGLRGRIVRRVAQRRVQQNRATLNYITDATARQRITDSFDRQLGVLLHELNEKVYVVRPLLTKLRDDVDGTLYLSTDRHYLYICLHSGQTNEPAAPVLPDGGISRQPVQVWLHSSLVGEDSAGLLRTWSVIGRFVDRAATGPARIAIQLAEKEVPVTLATSGPWTILGAGEMAVGEGLESS
jgi:hypothetical protein